MLGIDVGGTFTDLVYFADGELRHAKTLTTPSMMQAGVRSGLERLVNSLEGVDHIFHGTTAVINALLESKGATVGLLTTKGFRDVFEIGRGTRPEVFDMTFVRPVRYVPRRRRIEINERIDAAGAILTEIDEAEVVEAVQDLVAQGVDSIAVSFINAYVNPVHEQAAAAAIARRWPDLPVTLGHDLAREWREYERTSTAVMNAYVKPKMSRYVDDLNDFLVELGFRGSLELLQSNGGTVSRRIAAAQPLRMVESGPAAGMVAAAALARQIDLGKVISFDMGGTTAKGGVISDYVVKTVRPYYVGGVDGLPSLLPVSDIVEVSSGGGSIAYIDEAGAIKVGPQSAGADPGPVSYRRGGTKPTVTDAHVVLGRIDPEAFLDGEMPLDVEGARSAFSREISEPLGMSVEEVASGILKIATTSMALMLRRVTIAKGHDPRELTMVASGGAGPLHAVDIARELSVPRVVIPVMPAHWSAFGMLLSDTRQELVITMREPLDDSVLPKVKEIARKAGQTLIDTFVEDGHAADHVRLQVELELCYAGQEHPLLLDFHEGVDSRTLASRFHESHAKVYGFSTPAQAVVLRSVKMDAMIALTKPALGRPDIPSDVSAEPVGWRRAFVADRFQDVAVYRRERLPGDQPIHGPAVIHEGASTTVIGNGDQAYVDRFGNLIISLARQ